MNKMKGIIAAGTLTGLVLITIVAFGFRGVDAQNDSISTPVIEDVTLVQPTNDASGQEAVQAWQDYSSELETAVKTMQAREAQYQNELNTANQTINNLQTQLNQNNQGNVNVRVNRYEEHEHEEHEGFEHDD